MDHRKHSELTFYKNSLNTQKQKEGHLSNIATAMTDGNQKVQLMAVNPSNNQEQLASDGNGNLKCNFISAVAVYPHHSVDGEGTPTTSFNVKVNNTNNLNTKLEDLSSSLQFGHSNNNRSLAVGINNKVFENVVTLKNNENINGYYQFISGLHKRGDKITVMVKSETGSSQWNLQIEQSIDNSQFIDVTGNLNAGNFQTMLLYEFTMIAPYYRITFQNIDVASAFTIKYIN